MAKLGGTGPQWSASHCIVEPREFREREREREKRELQWSGTRTTADQSLTCPPTAAPPTHHARPRRHQLRPPAPRPRNSAPDRDRRSATWRLSAPAGVAELHEIRRQRSTAEPPVHRQTAARCSDCLRELPHGFRRSGSLAQQSSSEESEDRPRSPPACPIAAAAQPAGMTWLRPQWNRQPTGWGWAGNSSVQRSAPSKNFEIIGEWRPSSDRPELVPLQGGFDGLNDGLHSTDGRRFLSRRSNE